MAKNNNAGKNLALPAWVGRVTRWMIFLGIVFLLVGFYRSRPKTATSKDARAASVVPAPILPVCSGAETYQFLPEKGITKIKVPMQTNCFSGFVTTPADWPRWYYQSDLNKGFSIWFLGESEPVRLLPNDTRWFGEKRGIFRVAGEGNLFVSIEK